MNLLNRIWVSVQTVDPGYQHDGGEAKREKRVAFWIGIMALCLGLGVHFVDVLFGVSCRRASISAYYYEPTAGPVFVGVLVFVAAFMFRFRGDNLWDGVLATVGAISAIVVAIFPTKLDQFCLNDDARIDIRPNLTFQLEDGAIQPLAVTKLTFQGLEAWHLTGAVVLLLILLYFAGLAFPRIRAEDRNSDGTLLPKKWWRNALYYFCSFLMVAGFLLIAWHWLGGERLIGFHPVFLGEALALSAFGFAWMVKGRFWFGYLDTAGDFSKA